MSYGELGNAAAAGIPKVGDLWNGLYEITKILQASSKNPDLLDIYFKTPNGSAAARVDFSYLREAGAGGTLDYNGAMAQAMKNAGVCKDAAGQLAFQADGCKRRAYRDARETPEYVLYHALKAIMPDHPWLENNGGGVAEIDAINATWDVYLQDIRNAIARTADPSMKKILTDMLADYTARRAAGAQLEAGARFLPTQQPAAAAGKPTTPPKTVLVPVPPVVPTPKPVPVSTPVATTAAAGAVPAEGLVKVGAGIWWVSGGKRQGIATWEAFKKHFPNVMTADLPELGVDIDTASFEALPIGPPITEANGPLRSSSTSPLLAAGLILGGGFLAHRLLRRRR